MRKARLLQLAELQASLIEGIGSKHRQQGQAAQTDQQR
jgi:hypothetical protein